MTNCSATACPPSGSNDVSQATEDSLLVLGRPSASRGRRSTAGTGDRRQAPRDPERTPVVHGRIPSIIPMPSAASASWRMWRNCSARSISLGRNGQSSCTPSNGNGWSATTPARRASPARRAQARPSWHCIGPPIWRARIPNARVLLTTFSDTLANALQTKLRRLVGNEPRLGGAH